MLLRFSPYRSFDMIRLLSSLSLFLSYLSARLGSSSRSPSNSIPRSGTSGEKERRSCVGTSTLCKIRRSTNRFANATARFVRLSFEATSDLPTRLHHDSRGSLTLPSHISRRTSPDRCE